MRRAYVCSAGTIQVSGNAVEKLNVKIKPNGSLGYTSVLPEKTGERNPSVKISRVYSRADASKVRKFSEDLRDWRLILPIGRRLELRDTAEAHVLGERGGAGKILMLI